MTNIRRFPINLGDPDKYQLIVESPEGSADQPQGKYYIRVSVLGVNFMANFIENFEDTYHRKARIVEFGDGVSTLWWGKNFPDNEIISIGGNRWWFDWVEKLLTESGCKNVNHIFEEQTNYYTTENVNNMNYLHCIDALKPPFDLIINDGGMREIIGDHILSNADSYISPGGIYIRHDYEMAILGNWVGFRDKLPEWCRDEKDLGYDGFCHTHPEYSLVTTTGNGLAGYVMEFGGVWRHVDHQWIRKTSIANEPTT